MASRTARTAWHGTVSQGTGQVELTSSGAGTFNVSFPQRVAEKAEVTSPEELIAAALSSCYAMQFSALIGEAGGTPVALEIRADVSIGADPAGGLRIPTIALTVHGEVEGLDADGFPRVAHAAKETCPVSKALAGTTITLVAVLD